jgi:hypothetical protein
MLRHITESNETRKQKIKKTKQNEAKNYRQEIDKDESETCKPKTERSISLARALVHTHTHTHIHTYIYARTKNINCIGVSFSTNVQSS